MAKKKVTSLEAVIFSVAIFLLSVIAAIAARSFKIQAAVVPFAVTFALIIFTGINCFIEIKKYRAGIASGDNKVHSFSDWIQKNKKMLKMWGWVLSLFLGIYLIGILYAGIIFVFCFLFFEAKMKLAYTLLTTVIVGLIIQFVFIMFFSFNPYKGIIFNTFFL